MAPKGQIKRPHRPGRPRGPRDARARRRFAPRGRPVSRPVLTAVSRPLGVRAGHRPRGHGRLRRRAALRRPRRPAGRRGGRARPTSPSCRPTCASLDRPRPARAGQPRRRWSRVRSSPATSLGERRLRQLGLDVVVRADAGHATSSRRRSTARHPRPARPPSPLGRGRRSQRGLGARDPGRWRGLGPGRGLAGHRRLGPDGRTRAQHGGPQPRRRARPQRRPHPARRLRHLRLVRRPVPRPPRRGPRRGRGRAGGRPGQPRPARPGPPRAGGEPRACGCSPASRAPTAGPSCARPSVEHTSSRSRASSRQFVVVDCGFAIEDDEELSYDTLAPRRNAATLDRARAGRRAPRGRLRPTRSACSGWSARCRTSAAVPSPTPRVVVNKVRASAVGTRPRAPHRRGPRPVRRDGRPRLPALGPGHPRRRDVRRDARWPSSPRSASCAARSLPLDRPVCRGSAEPVGSRRRRRRS